jgi:hypothetical protein
MRALTTAIILGFFALLASPAFADGPLTARTDAQKDEDARIDRAYKAATRSYDGAAAKVDPWGAVRPADTDKKNKR